MSRSIEVSGSSLPHSLEKLIAPVVIMGKSNAGKCPHANHQIQATENGYTFLQAMV